jgi:RNA polymerase sigma-70 factor (ECF subfamily)
MRAQTSFTNEAYVHYNYLVNVAKRFTQNSMDAEDLVQDTYVSAFKFYDSFREGSNCRAWLYTIMKNIFFSYCRKNKNMTEVHTSEFPDKAEFPGSESTLTRDEVLKFMEKINEDFRKVIVLYHLEEYTLKEISDRLKWPLGTVKSRLHRGRKEFREVLSKSNVIC